MQVVPNAVALEILARYSPSIIAHDGNLPQPGGMPFCEDDQYGRRYICLRDNAHDSVTFRAGPFHPHAREFTDPNAFSDIVTDLRSGALAPWN
jgi:hypothetical protein